MGYQALLFCPDEKTARTVTQVLSELEFSIESCTEPFAAVKKLMGQHFDAVVVDCDNEQNATLLFKSARNSTSNQASLAVGVVEGQAGVAKAFRIGANLVLTKPINIEQAKGTLRVARGLLRKSEPAKGAPAPTVSSPTPVATKPVPPKVAAPAAPALASTPISTSTSPVKPAENRAWPAPAAAAAASSAPTAQDDDLLDIGWDDSVASPTPSATVAQAFGEAMGPVNAGSSATHGSGAATAPALAREVRDSHVAESSPKSAAREGDTVLEEPADTASSESASVVAPAPSFTFGGANVPTESKGGGKKIILGIAAAAIIGAGIYVGWPHLHGPASEPVMTQPAAPSAPAAMPQTAKPSVAKPSATSTTSALSTSSSTTSAPTKNKSVDVDSSFGEDDVTSLPVSTKPSGSDSTLPSKTAAAPLIVKSGTSSAVHTKSAVPDTQAPSMIGIATAGAGAPPPNLVAGEGSAPKPVLQTLNISQGVSQGLLMKKVQPIYPRNALNMRIEGTVELMATISKTGDISRVKILSGDSQLTRAAADAVKQWKYKPYLLNGEPVEIQTQVTINFKLPR